MAASTGNPPLIVWYRSGGKWLEKIYEFAVKHPPGS
jgi:hypothetical protein